MAVIDLQLPAGFRFHPTDEELVIHYLCRKCASQPISVPIIAEIDIYNHDPWHLPKLAMYGEKEWYFFSQRHRKYPNGSRPNRVAGSGYWKATGADKPIGRLTPIGIKKALVFYSGKAPRGEKTNWIMHEYRLADSPTKNTKLDDWVLCRIYNKKGVIEQAATPEEVTKAQDSSMVNVDTSDSIPTNSNYEHLLSSEMESARKVAELDNSAFFTDEYLDYAGNIILPSSDICFMMN